jgi:hypothetical protein
MATVDKDFADNLVLNRGYYNGDDDNSLGDNPRVTRIVEYTNAWGAKAYGFTTGRDDPLKYLRETEYVRSPRVYWEYKA